MRESLPKSQTPELAKLLRLRHGQKEGGRSEIRGGAACSLFWLFASTSPEESKCCGIGVNTKLKSYGCSF